MTTKPDRPRDEHDDVGTLLRLAGPRAAVPTERAERVRSAAYATWKRKTRVRSHRRFVWAGAAAVAACLMLAIGFGVIPFGTGPSPTADVLTVASLSGPAWVRDSAGTVPSTSRPLAVGDGVTLGSELDTPETGRVAVRLSSGHSVRLDRSTRVRVLEAGVLALDRGAVYVDSGMGRETVASLSIRTPLGIVEEIGTQFEVRLEEDSVRVRLREGAVVVHRDEGTYDVVVGGELEIGVDGSVATRELATHGSEWAWVADITPMLELDGRSARDFLEWVARERGWTLSFADEQVARSAEEIVLGGTVSALTLDQALETVLPTCRMVHHVTDGTLIVETEM